MQELPLFIIVGPSGVGKTTLYNMILEEFPNVFELSISYTTRAIRPNEKNNVNYYYITNEEFNKRKGAGEFLEHACYVGNQYGTSREEINRIRNKEKIPLLEIDINGYKQVLEKGVPLNGVFVTINDAETLKRRLHNRGCNQIQDIDKRLQRSMQEIEEAKECPFALTIFNDDLQSAYALLSEKIKQWYAPIISGTLPKSDERF